MKIILFSIQIILAFYILFSLLVLQAYASLGRYREAIENVHLAISLSPSTETGPESDAAQVVHFVSHFSKEVMRFSDIIVYLLR